eukprot:scaffold203045_cov66-Cyclotella_meneghiniana.AAC.1
MDESEIFVFGVRSAVPVMAEQNWQKMTPTMQQTFALGPGGVVSAGGGLNTSSLREMAKNVRHSDGCRGFCGEVITFILDVEGARAMGIYIGGGGSGKGAIKRRRQLAQFGNPE